MTEPHKRAHRHPNYKTAYRVKNWAEYDKALRDRGDITPGISQDAIEAWTPPQIGKRGAQPVYSEHKNSPISNSLLTFYKVRHWVLQLKHQTRDDR